mmetsp:Transcript_381/g.1238  ORF Transcript_381/g.1238 Transcript_381/m.1238 type:complete len:175 (+) Transcript_381:164-688(+)
MPPQAWGQFPPEASVHGINKRSYYESKFGKERSEMMYQRLSSVFENLGIKYSLGGNTGPTLDSHRLITWSARFGAEKQNALVEALFKSYFVEEKAPCERDVLVAAAEEAGLEGAEALLSDPQGCLQEVEQELQHARGISGVPYFIVSNGSRTLTFSGAQPPDTFVEALEELSGA